MCNWWLHKPFPPVVQEVQFVQSLLSDQVAHIHLTSPEAPEDLGNQEGLGRPENKSELYSGLWHMWRTTLTILIRCYSPLNLEVPLDLEDLPVRCLSLPATHCNDGMIQILYLWNKLNKQQLLTLSPLGPGGPRAPWQEIKQYCKIIHNAFFPPICIKCTCILCTCYCSFLLFRWSNIPFVLVFNPSGLAVIAVNVPCNLKDEG